MYWVICEPMKNDDDDDCGHRWIAFPATEETLADVIEIAKLLVDSNKFWITREVDHALL